MKKYWIIIVLFVLASCTTKKTVTAQSVNETKKESVTAKSDSVATVVQAITQKSEDQTKTVETVVEETTKTTFDPDTGKPKETTTKKTTRTKQIDKKINQTQSASNNSHIAANKQKQSNTEDRKKNKTKTTEKEIEWSKWWFVIPILILGFFLIKTAFPFLPRL